MVASWGGAIRLHFSPASFQSPSLRGSGRFLWWAAFAHLLIAFVSIPFIAGQWSLRRVVPGPWQTPEGRFNPLHCGAVVASAMGFTPPNGGVRGFQSPSLRGSGRFRAKRLGNQLEALAFQSPSLRGSGRFKRGRGARLPRGDVSIPFIAGQWSLPSPEGGRAIRLHIVSIPFIAGQWSLHDGGGGPSWKKKKFQSPSLRGSGRFGRADFGRPPGSSSFNPLHCGAVVASGEAFAPFGAAAEFQSPSLRGSGRFGHGRRMAGVGGRVSIPFIAGQWSLPSITKLRRWPGSGVSIPFIAGQWSLRRKRRRAATPSGGFNPLHCGAVVASKENDHDGTSTS